MRLNRYLASCGLGSRRAMDTLIASGRVRVNDLPLEGPGQPVDPARDRVTLDGRALTLPTEKIVLAFNKPVGVLTTMYDPEGRPTVADYVCAFPFRVFPVGRLDMDSAGLLLFTNDGKLAHRLAHPRYGVEKEYRVLAEGRLTPDKIRALEEGIELEEGITSPARVYIPDARVSPQECVFHIVLHEGWKREVRRMCAAVGLDVLELTRLRYGAVQLGDLAPGTFRRLDENAPIA
ncbi:MAG: rRNA pseudouridine synthase [Spirochaetota bacterium]|jgi:pseudouridine synthase|nr:rRNA pseudouridine synthase [Spirochaetota bacterium]